MVSINAGGRALVPPHLNVPDFVDFLCQPLPIGRSEWQVDLGGGMGGEEL